MAVQECLMLSLDMSWPHLLEEGLGGASFVLATPYPRVAVPESGKDLNTSLLGTTIGHGDANQDVFGTRFCILSTNIPILPFIKHTL